MRLASPVTTSNQDAPTVMARDRVAGTRSRRCSIACVLRRYAHWSASAASVSKGDVAMISRRLGNRKE
jgi:hypothetical protein